MNTLIFLPTTLLMITISRTIDADNLEKLTIKNSLIVFEHSSIGHLVGGVNDQLRLYGHNTAFSFQFLRKRKNSLESHLSINKETGEIRVESDIDRERVCRDPNQKCLFELQIAARSIDRHYLIILPVIIEDINDNIPTFDVPNNFYELEIAENTMKGYRVRLPTAKDTDFNSIVSYHLSSNENRLPVELFIENGDVFLSLIENLDYERKRIYDFDLKACDPAVGKCSSLKIKLKVIDLDDNPPRFLVRQYRFEVHENATNETAIGIVRAHDKDSLSNLKYKIAAEENVPFLINSNSGRIFLNENIDAERKADYEFKVLVSDGTGSSDSAVVQVKIIDIDDNPSELIFQPEGNGTTIEKHEYVYNYSTLISTNGRLGQLEISDLDVSFSSNKVILNNPSRKLFYLLTENDRQILILNMTQLDALNEIIRPNFIQILNCSVHVNDQEFILAFKFKTDNHFAPEFDQSRYVFEYSIDEFIKLDDNGKSVGKVMATDKDQDAIGYYLIATQDSDLFNIENGNIFTTKPIPLVPYEYKLRVGARDEGDRFPRRHSEPVDVSIRIGDILQRRSRDHLIWNFQFPEGSTGLIGRLFSKKIGIKLKGTGADNFGVDSHTNIYAKHALDRERRSKYYLNIFSDRKKNNNVWIVIIDLLDINDNAPIIDYPFPNANCHFARLIAGQILFRVRAHDPDEGPNAYLSYRLSKTSNPQEAVVMLDRDGNIIATKNCSGENSYYVEVIITDNGSPAMSTSIGFQIHVSKGITPFNRSFMGNFIGSKSILFGSVFLLSILLVLTTFLCLIRRNCIENVILNDCHKKKTVGLDNLQISNEEYVRLPRNAIDEGGSVAMSSYTSKPATEEEYIRSSGEISRNCTSSSHRSSSCEHPLDLGIRLDNKINAMTTFI
ncbi:hypothetical protein ACOME3_006953 [Neoechinorhynchus agilis]